MRPGSGLNKRLLFINSTSSFLSWGLKTLLLFGVQKYLLSRVSLEEYSLYPVLASIMIFVDLIRNLLSGGVGRFIVEADVQGDSERVTRIASSMFVIQSIAAAMLVILGTVFTWFLPHILSVDPRFVDDARIMMGIMIASFVFNIATTSFEVGLFARERFVVQNILELSSVLLRIVLMVVLFGLFHVRVIWVALSAEGANIVTQIVKVAISRKLIPALRFRRDMVDRGKAKELLKYSSWSFLQVVSYRVFTNFDPIVLNQLASAFDVTVFYLGSLIKKQISTVLLRITTPIMPSLIGMHALLEHERLKRAYYQFGKYYIWLFMAASLPFMVYGYDFFTIYVGTRYTLAATVMFLLFISSIPNLPNNMISRTVVAQGRIKPLAFWSFVSQVINIILTLIFVGPLHMGALGSALASFTVSVAFQPVVEYILARRMLGVRFGELMLKTVLPGFAPSLVAAAVLFGIRLLDRPDTWTELILYSGAGELVLIPATYLFFTPHERELIGTLIRRLAGRGVPESGREAGN